MCHCRMSVVWESHSEILSPISRGRLRASVWRNGCHRTLRRLCFFFDRAVMCEYVCAVMWCVHILPHSLVTYVYCVWPLVPFGGVVRFCAAAFMCGDALCFCLWSVCLGVCCHCRWGYPPCDVIHQSEMSPPFGALLTSEAAHNSCGLRERQQPKGECRVGSLVSCWLF